MGYKEIRINQIISPFGPGNLHVDKHGIPHVICGLDHWYKSQDYHMHGIDNSRNVVEETEFIITEPRLSDLLGVPLFKQPPDYRTPRIGATVQPPNLKLPVPALRFPTWYSCTKNGDMTRFQLSTKKLEKPDVGGRWQPVRFAAVCAKGCLTDFPWQKWIGCQCSNPKLRMNDSGGTELTGILVECMNRRCLKKRNLRGITQRPDDQDNPDGSPAEGTQSQSATQKAGITCQGERAWLGKGADIDCGQPLVGVLINQTNLHLSNIISAIHIPCISEDEETQKIIKTLEDNASLEVGMAKTLLAMGTEMNDQALSIIETTLTKLEVEAPREVIEKALNALIKGSSYSSPDAVSPSENESKQQTIRREEFNIIRNEYEGPGKNDDLRVVKGDVPVSLSQWIARINRVESLRETRVYCGFSRLEAQRSIDTMPDSAMKQLFRNPPVNPQDKWLPAVKTFGEGLYLELKESRIKDWQMENDEWIKSRISHEFLNNLLEQDLLIPPLSADSDILTNWASRYLLTHTLAHALITQMTFETGYGTASMRERLFISADPAAPMAGILIYTAAGDSDGTLGGLVRLGYREIIEAVFMNAMSRISWCSADPVCCEQKEGTGSRGANLAACNACVMLPETSCETFNHGLDRAMIIGTPYNRKPGFMSTLVDRALEYGN